jgi:hypothetical protein
VANCELRTHRAARIVGAESSSSSTAAHACVRRFPFATARWCSPFFPKSFFVRFGHQRASDAWASWASRRGVYSLSFIVPMYYSFFSDYLHLLLSFLSFFPARCRPGSAWVGGGQVHFCRWVSDLVYQSPLIFILNSCHIFVFPFSIVKRQTKHIAPPDSNTYFLLQKRLRSKKESRKNYLSAFERSIGYRSCFSDWK